MFVLVTLGIMGVSIFLIYKLTNHFGFRMKYRSLILCAFMAFLVNVAAISMSPYLTQAHYIRLAFLVIASAAVVTVYNERLVCHEKMSLASADDEQLFAGAAMPALAIVDENAGPEPQKTAQNPPPSRLHEESPAAEKSGKTADTLIETPEAKAEQKHKPEAKVEPKHKPEAKAEPKHKQPEAKAKASPAMDFSRFHSLDDILDYAFEQKSKHRIDQAILAYKGALDKYQDDPYAPFIVIDLGNIYKEKAAYSDAVRTYEDALFLPVIANDAATSEKFKENLSYLRTVQYILSKHNSLQTPFQKIPADYLKEIETEFQMRQKQS